MGWGDDGSDAPAPVATAVAEPDAPVDEPVDVGEPAPDEGSDDAGLPSWLTFWRSPPDQPRWARPALLAVAALAAVAYAWAITSDPLETFYGDAARSMAGSFHNFFFGALDPWGTITTDKLPGSFWVDAVFVRLFGFHLWAVVLPHVIEGVLTVLVLYRAVRRLAGPVAGLAASVVLAASPATVLLTRGNIPDTLLILLLVLAADATSAAMASGNRRQLLLGGVWVGLAFQAKMLDAWLVVPALFLAYLVSGIEATGRRRLVSCAWAGLVTVAVSLSYMVVVTLVPASHRPYIDGSGDNSLFTQVFVYNGLDRFHGLANLDHAVGPPAPFFRLTASAHPNVPSVVSDSVPAGIGRLLTGWFGRDGGWLLPLAAMALVVLLVVYRRQRTHPVFRAGVLWGTWLVIEFAALSAGGALKSYYPAVLMPAVAALVGIGWSVVWARAPASRRLRLVVAVAVFGSAVYAVYLLPTSQGAWNWFAPLVLGLATASAVLLLWPHVRSRLIRPAGLLLGAGAVLLMPLLAVVTVTVSGLGPFDTPFEPAAVAQYASRVRPAFAEANAYVGAFANATPLATDTSEYAANFGMILPGEVLPIGGFAGAVPSPTLAQLQQDIRHRGLHTFLLPVSPRSPDPRVQWVIHHCAQTSRGHGSPVAFAYFDCSPGATR
jgi:4-amino-4-deoxy-L-arabinose transferase-like glycosyltransferase